MKKQRQWLLKLIFINLTWFGLVSEARADAMLDLLIQIRDATQATAKYVNSILSDLESTGKQVLDALTKPTPQVNDVTKANTQIGASLSKMQSDYELPLTQNAVKDLLTNTPERLSNSSQAKLLAMPGPDFPSYKAGISSLFSILPNLQVSAPGAGGGSQEGPSPFDLGTLLGKVAFPDGETQTNKGCQSKPPLKPDAPLCQNYAAQGLIGYISALSNPPLVPAFSGLKKQGVTENQAAELRDSDKVKRYLAELRSYVAAQSVGINNFYYLYAQRIIQEGLGKTLNVHKPSTVNATGAITAGEVIPDVSPLQAEEYLANRRVRDPAWYKDMESTTSPLTIARETLYVLAEMRWELFKTRLENQRLLATLSTVQLQSMRTQKLLLDQQGAGITLPKPPSATPPEEAQTSEEQQQQAVAEAAAAAGLSPEQIQQMQQGGR